jgi:hypothetical protein
MLVANIFGGGGVNGVLGHVRGVIADAFETAGNEDQIQIAAKLLGIFGHPLDQTTTGGAIHLVKALIPRND